MGKRIDRIFELGGLPAFGHVIDQSLRQVELFAAGLVNRRGNDYFNGRLLFPLADARGRVRGFQARKLRDDDPLRAKYVNSPEGELFRKGDMLYGLDRARQPIAVQNIGTTLARVHFDLETDDVAAEVFRLLKLGAVEAYRHDDWVVLADPAGLLFCVVPAEAPDFAERSVEVSD